MARPSKLLRNVVYFFLLVEKWEAGLLIFIVLALFCTFFFLPV